jgi:taurine transport system ATP-binding protein
VIVALAHVDLTMRDGDFVVAIGASGCGKTTLLSTIAGFLAPTEGAVTLDGAPITGPARRPRRGRSCATALMPWLTVIDNVAVRLQMRGLGKAVRHEVAREKLAVVGLTGFETRMIYELSGGMQQRVGSPARSPTTRACCSWTSRSARSDALTRESSRRSFSGLAAHREDGVLHHPQR